MHTATLLSSPSKPPDTPDTAPLSSIFGINKLFSLAGSAPDTAVSPPDTPVFAPFWSGCRAPSGDCREACPTGFPAQLCGSCTPVLGCRARRADSEAEPTPPSHQRLTCSGRGKPTRESPLRHQDGSAPETRSSPPSTSLRSFALFV